MKPQKRQQVPPRGPISPHVAGVNPLHTRSGKSISGVSSQGALVKQDTLKTMPELQKSLNTNIKAFLSRIVSRKHTLFEIICHG
jgi:hypothetical protein